ncbi:MAG: ABC transporter permease [Puniceicoccales bacterium]|jgi:phospholipid/cholesterol/gamma-HCH transport system permease protein|nr:ABC transporter permease [Puniceicoccales bacterium]
MSGFSHSISGAVSSANEAVAEWVSTEARPCILRIAGVWNIRGTSGIPRVESLLRKIADGKDARIIFDCSGLARHDSSLAAFLLEFHHCCVARGAVVDFATLPPLIARLLALALVRSDGRSGSESEERARPEGSFFQRMGGWGISSVNSWTKAFDFLGQTVIAVWNLVRGRARTRLSECWLFIQACGVDALPIVSLISFLTGLILAYIGAVQMKQFGATQYVAGMVGLAMVREMGALMAGVILCGRTATAYAAQLGSMQVSEEISAFRVLGIPPMEYLVLPRIIALVCMMPLLTLYADLCGIFGGLVVVTSMDVTLEQYYTMTLRAINMTNFLSGLIKSVFFAMLIGWAGCFRGMVCGKSSQAVGDAATSAAVLGITLLVIADAVFAVLFDAINFF